MAKNLKYPTWEVIHNITGPDPIYYNGKLINIEMNILEEFGHNPIQLAAAYVLSKTGSYGPEIKNPIGHLMALYFNEETSDDLDLDTYVRGMMEDMVLELDRRGAKTTNAFLLMDRDFCIEDQEDVAAEMIRATDDNQLRRVLIINLLYEAMCVNCDNFPFPYR